MDYGIGNWDNETVNADQVMETVLGKNRQSGTLPKWSQHVMRGASDCLKYARSWNLMLVRISSDSR